MKWYQCPTLINDLYVKGNLVNILKTISIHISIKKGILENINIGMDCSLEEIMLYTALFKVFHDVFFWLCEEMLGINPSIV